ncbi:MAG: CHAT domain-containing protein [Elainellaceae cyanobacterium]
MRFSVTTHRLLRFARRTVRLATVAGVMLAVGYPTPAIAEPSVPEGAAVELNAIEWGRELAELERLPFDSRSPQQQARLEELRQMQADLMQQFQEFADSAEVQRAISQLQSLPAQLPLDTLTILQDDLQQLEQNAVVLYPLILEDRLELILVSATAPPIQRTVEVSRVELNQTTVAFRQALENPISDPLPMAQQLYTWLLQPFADELTAGETDTILYAPDRQLRYIPLAALHDGEQWLAERYAINNMSAASLTDLDRPSQVTPQAQVLAAAHTEGSFEVVMGNRPVQIQGFAFGLPEVEAIANHFPNTTKLYWK